MNTIILKPIKKEIDIVTNHISIEKEVHDVIDYSKKVCVKPWGYEFLTFLNKKVGIWCLTIYKGQSTSLHCHFHKDTLLVVLSGCAKINLINNEVRYLNTLQSMFIPRKKFHGISSFSDSTCILELEIYSEKVTYTDKNDLLRIDDQYKRKPVGYESSVNVVTTNLDNYNTFELLESKPVILNNTRLTISRNLKDCVNEKQNGYCILLEGNLQDGISILKEGSIITTPSVNCLDASCLFLRIEKLDWKEDCKIIYGLHHLNIIQRELKEQKKTVVLTSGCFDILHVGHLETLKKAKSFGDILIVCLSSDKQITALKGESRPINTFIDRLNLFKTIDYVDYIIPYEEMGIENEETLGTIMKQIDPDIWVKGSDYTVECILQKHPYLREVRIIPLLQDRSTTNIVKKIVGES